VDRRIKALRGAKASKDDKGRVSGKQFMIVLLKIGNFCVVPSGPTVYSRGLLTTPESV
jgi:hypothetical protein